MKWKVVYIEWLDSKGVTTAWESLDEIEPLLPILCHTIGFLLEETETFKTVAQSVSESQVLGRTTIPCCSIQNFREIIL